MAGAPLGNRNNERPKIWSAAIQRALERRTTRDKKIKAIDELADKLLDACAEGDLVALKELGDRLEGKPAQAITGADGNKLTLTLDAPWMSEVAKARTGRG